MKNHGTSRAAIIAPIFVPLLNIPKARARSFFGNHSAIVLFDAGKRPASPTAKKLRIIMLIERAAVARALSIPNIDHIISEIVRPSLVPILSIILPAKMVTRAYTPRNEDVRKENCVLDHPKPPSAMALQKNGFR